METNNWNKKLSQYKIKNNMTGVTELLISSIGTTAKTTSEKVEV